MANKRVATRSIWRKVSAAHSLQGPLPVFHVTVAGPPLRLGIQMCREIRYPEQWRVLAAQGAQVFAYVNNAVGGKIGDALWRAHLVSRAGETQRFIVGANNAAPDQTCPTIIIAPTGEPLSTLPLGTEAAAIASLDLGLVSDSVLSQVRDDVVGVTLREMPNG
jgi:predicted amidohydrolase